MEHINKKSFPACTRVTAHATFSQPLQPISLAFTSRQREGGEEGERRRRRFYTGDGWRGLRPWNRGWASFTESSRGVARDAKETGQRDGDYASGLVDGGRGWNLLPTNETSPSKTTLTPLPSTPCPFRPVSFSPSLDPVHLPLWYRFTRDLATDDGIRRERKKKEREEKEGKGFDDRRKWIKTRVKIIF